MVSFERRHLLQHVGHGFGMWLTDESQKIKHKHTQQHWQTKYGKETLK